MHFDPAQLGDDLDGYFAQAEARFDDIVPGTEKRVIWAGARGARTERVVLYVHGFSATSEEIRPVPDRVAAGLGANLIYTRLTGHGRTGAAMAQASAAAWKADLAEAMAAARLAGDRVLIIATSTGATLATAMAGEDQVMCGVEGMILVAPNFGVNNPLERLLHVPVVRGLLTRLAGDRRIVSRNDRHARYWTLRYPARAVLPMFDLIREVRSMNLADIRLPVLFYYAPDDRVVRPEQTAAVADAWGGPVTRLHPALGPDDDVEAHVIAGDILSPGQSEAALAAMLGWARALR